MTGTGRLLRWLLIAAFLILFVCSLFLLRSFTDQADFSWYTRHFCYAERPQVFRLLYGLPERVERQYSGSDNTLAYTTYHYGGFSLGQMSNDERICCIWVRQPGILPLRDGVDIGSSRQSVEAAYQNSATSSDGDSYILKHRSQHAYEGIWITPVYNDDVLVEFSVCNGAY